MGQGLLLALCTLSSPPALEPTHVYKDHSILPVSPPPLAQATSSVTPHLPDTTSGQVSILILAHNRHLVPMALEAFRNRIHCREPIFRCKFPRWGNSTATSPDIDNNGRGQRPNENENENETTVDCLQCLTSSSNDEDDGGFHASQPTTNDLNNNSLTWVMTTQPNYDDVDVLVPVVTGRFSIYLTFSFCDSNLFRPAATSCKNS
ncbi:hypothetical protein BDN72DRAFT_905782 [Pluteus cervinus]|uniref:Uncharacterized protein n=1 Tax=Pluteus cervinus TaxID=181527 RepID=A0ACD3A136_9AGAR|nr:hypothetical protein BDN72DRAFT_905782 [Pluteus cervinus]